MKTTIVRKLQRNELVRLVGNITHPKDTGWTSEEINQQLLVFCINCPDPAAAMDLMIECMTPMSAEELVDKALSYPPRDVASLPKSELPLTHPLRHMTLDL
jgi:hypothetical protein